MISAGIGALDIGAREADLRLGYAGKPASIATSTRVFLGLGSLIANLAYKDEVSRAVFYSDLPLWMDTVYTNVKNQLQGTTISRLMSRKPKLNVSTIRAVPTSVKPAPPSIPPSQTY